MYWPPFTPPHLVFYNIVQLMLKSAVSVAGFPLFIFVWMYRLCSTPSPMYLPLLGQNLPLESGQTIWLVGLALLMWTSGLLVHLAVPWGNKGISVMWKLVATWPDDGIWFRSIQSSIPDWCSRRWYYVLIGRICSGKVKANGHLQRHVTCHRDPTQTHWLQWTGDTTHCHCFLH